MIQEINKERVQDIDFSFVPSSQIEKEVTTPKVSDDLKALLYNDEAFTIKGLILVLTDAIKFGEVAKLRWHLRPTILSLVKLQESLLNYMDLQRIVSQLADQYSFLANEDHQIQMHFYLVQRKSLGKLSRLIYSSPFKIHEFLAFLNNFDECRFNVGEKAVEVRSISTDQSVGVLEIKPDTVSNSNIPFNLTYSCNRFIYEEILQTEDWNAPSIKRYTFTTRESLPYLSLAVSLLSPNSETNKNDNQQSENNGENKNNGEENTDCEEKILGKLDVLKERTKIATEIINERTQDLATTLPAKGLKKVWRIMGLSMAYNPLINLLNEHLNGESSILVQLVKSLSEKCPHKIEIIRLMKQLLKACKSALEVLMRVKMECSKDDVLQETIQNALHQFNQACLIASKKAGLKWETIQKFKLIRDPAQFRLDIALKMTPSNAKKGPIDPDEDF